VLERAAQEPIVRADVHIAAAIEDSGISSELDSHKMLALS